MPRSHGGSADAGTVLRGPPDVTGAGCDVAHRGAVNARCVRSRTRNWVRRNRPPARVSAADVARRCARTRYAAAGAARADPRRSDGTWNSMTKTLTAVRQDDADGIARRAARGAWELERRDRADMSRRRHIWRSRDQRFSVGAALQARRAAFKPDRLGAAATDDVTAVADTGAAWARSGAIGTGVRAVLLGAPRARRERSAQRYGDSKS